MIHYPSEARIAQINTRIINVDYPDNMLNEDRLNSAVYQIQQNVFGKELYDGLYNKASMLCFLISKGHAFIDGNKRTAIVATILFLSINDIIIDPSKQSLLEKNVLKLSTNKITTDIFANLLKTITK